MIEGQAERDPGAAIVADDREALVAERGHQADELAGHLALGVALTVRAAGRRLRRAVPAQIRRHNAVGGSQLRGDPIPADMRLREAV
jgi:hypothetical protein